jgi:lactoylglutathione lyase
VHVGRLIGLNHVALEVGSIDEALAFWERLFGPLSLRGRYVRLKSDMAFIDMGDQFVALMAARAQSSDVHRHVGIVVDDKAAAVEAGITVSAPPSLDLHDPWGNLLQVVDYREVQFTKAPRILAAMGFGGLEKTEAALAELRAKDLA